MTGTPLEEVLRQLIKKEGPIGVDRFMALVLAHPEHGYYRSSIPIGKEGDFTTAPEISQMFGELIGLWLYQEACNQRILPESSDKGAFLMELGPGRGTLMADILRSLAVVAEGLTWPVQMIEINPALKVAQQKKLGKVGNATPSWKGDIAQLPAHPLLLVANEFFDALPIRQYISRRTRWHERQIFLFEDQLAFTENEIPATLDLPLQQPGTIAEICPDAVKITERLAGHITQHGGAMLIIDYGKESPFGDSLQAVRSHRPVDVLSKPGITDLSAWVDFAAIRTSALGVGAHVLGPVDQGSFLKELGLFQRAEQLGLGQPPAIRRQIAAAVDRLTSPAQMGRVFKVMAILPAEITSPVAGF
ncbi:class I SAM-dependent methyltransferase [Alphaproteobacteria bacterium LSUCC0684]